MNHQIGEWIYYNFAAECFHAKKLCCRFYSTKIDFYSQKMTISLFKSPFGGLKGNVYTISIARWKVRGSFLICDN